MSITPDHVCKNYARKKTKITIRTLDGDGDMLLIEGERGGLEFLGKLLLAQARASDCGFQLGRQGAGKTFFTKASTAGIYIHRLHQAPIKKPKRNQSSQRRRATAPAVAHS